jgi:hypothetical protein
MAQETLTRTLQATDGENVVYVTSQLESALAIDRPVSWAEHATIGPPFLEKGKTVVDMSAANCRVRPWKTGSIPGHLAYEKDFKWPMAPTNDGGQADLRTVPPITTGWTLRAARWIRHAGWSLSRRCSWRSTSYMGMCFGGRTIRG